MERIRIGPALRMAASLVLLAGAGWAEAARESRPARPRISKDMAREINRFADEAGRKAARCYRAPRVASDARMIVTVLRVRYSQTGAVIGLPQVVSQSGITPLNSIYAARMAEAARMAVMRCSPVPIPPRLSRQPWNELDLVFSPVRRV